MGRARASARARTERALRTPNSGSPGTLGGAGRVAPAQPRVRRPTRPSAPPGLRHFFHLPPHCGAPTGGTPPGPRAWGCCAPPPLPQPSFVALEVTVWAALVSAFPFTLAVPDHPSPPTEVPGSPAAPARGALRVVLKLFCQETPAGGRGAVRSAVSTAARGGQRAFTQPSFPPPPTKKV